MSEARGPDAEPRGPRLGVLRYNWLANHKLVDALRRARPHARGRLLDVGCGSRPFAPLFQGRVESYVGLDLRGSHDTALRLPDVYADAALQPFPEATFDTVLSISVMNHVERPGPVLAEMRRVLKPGGRAILEFVHMAPLYEPTFDYRRFTAGGARRLVEEAGFEVVEEIRFGGWPAYMGLVLISALNRMNRGPWRVVTEIPVRLLYVLIQSLAEFLDRLVPNDREALSRLLIVGRPER